MSVTAERIGDVIVPVLTDLGLHLYDLEYTGASLRVLVDREGGVDLADLTAATRSVSAALDEADLISNAYTLEVSSPGLERNLRTPVHFVGAVGDLVKIKTRPNTEGDRRIDGRLVAADDLTITVRGDDGSDNLVQLVDVERARTHFVGDAAPKPGAGSRPGKHPKASTSSAPGASGTKKPKKPKKPKPNSSTTQNSPTTWNSSTTESEATS